MEMLTTGEYSGLVAAAYLAAGLILAVLTVASVRGLVKAKKALAALEPDPALRRGT